MDCCKDADCDEDKYCASAEHLYSNTCQDLMKIGEHCNSMRGGEDCESGHCNTPPSKWIKNVCAPLESDGEKCLYDGDCASGVCREKNKQMNFKWRVVKICISLRYAAAARVAGVASPVIHRYPAASPLSPRYPAAARVAGVRDKFKDVHDKMKDVRDKFKDEERFHSPAASPASHRYLDASQDMAGFDRKDFRFKLAQN